MGKKIILSSGLILAVYFLAAQTAKAWTWTSYNIAFQAPSDLDVKENSTSIFYAGNGNIFLNIYPGKGESLTYDKMPEALQKWAGESKVTFDSSGTGYLSNMEQLWAYYINGTGYKGMSVYLLLLVDSVHPEKSYYLWLQYKSGFDGAAFDILKSFSLQ